MQQTTEAAAHELTPLRPTRPGLVCAACNQKGGVGKTTIICLLARAASVLGLRVLVIDADPQGNATSALSQVEVDELDANRGLAQAIDPHDPTTLVEVLVATDWEGVDLVPTPDGVALSNTAKAVDRMEFGREHVMRDAVRPVLDDYDLVLIDTTPALGRLLLLALAAADLALPVTQPELWSADGLDELHETINLVATYHNQALRSIGPVVNQLERTKRHQRVLAEDIRPYYGPAGWTADEDLIPRWTDIPKYLEAGSGLDQGSARERRVADVLATFVRRMLQAGGRI